MKFISTRSTKDDLPISSAMAIKQGLAPDGGLYVPESIPAINQDFISSLIDKEYSERAFDILSLFLDDYTAAELKGYCDAAYCEANHKSGLKRNKND